MPSNDGPPLPDAPLPRRFEELVAMRGVSEVRRDARDVEMQRKLDAFRGAMSGPYLLPGGTEVSVPAPFRMSHEYESQKTTIPLHAAELKAAVARAHLSEGAYSRIEAGRGTPEEIHRLTQALIDVHRLAPGEHWNDAVVRHLMFDCGIGLDCAWYVQQAFLQTTGLTRAQAGFKDPIHEDLSSLKGFARVPDLRDVRPGDIVVLGPPLDLPDQPGHRVIVYDQHIATGPETRDLIESPDAVKNAFAVRGPIRVFQVDSSWGCSGQWNRGGVERNTWWYNESTGLWAYMKQERDGTKRFTMAATPYGHAFAPPNGIFRREERP